eukprot:CAMPEP_0171934048 /NCGR_PEP_ID=MMETSP0993-20121228/31668_1 /TAXON_ID=483369 /ORGANISM="non described non described, Strain CCMP2098" /LENGTH=322 /DNA_ID=CAMNT_0012574673 /DNA_START=550 /DNA_END=1514 /DNA_ORIENTATION=-
MSFASPRGAAAGLKVLEACACDPRVRFVLTVRNLLDMVVSRMAYHKWSCKSGNNQTTTTAVSNADTKPASPPASVATDGMANGASSLGNTTTTRCGGMDHPSCCWRKNAVDVVQSWVLCREQYHLRVAQLLEAAGAASNRLLVVDLLREGEHRVYSRLKAFMAEAWPHLFQRALRTVPSKKVDSSGRRGRDSSGDGGGDGGVVGAVGDVVTGEDGREMVVGRKGVLKPVKLLRRHTNKQNYAPGLKACLREYALGVLTRAPLSVPRERTNAPLLTMANPLLTADSLFTMPEPTQQQQKQRPQKRQHQQHHRNRESGPTATAG